MLRIAALPALIGAIVGIGGFERFIPQDPYMRAAEDAGQAMLALPGFQDRFGSLEDDEAFRVGSELGAAAIPRLPDSELGEWLTITRQLLESLDVENCAAIVRGTTDPDAAVDAFKVLDIGTFRRYMEIVLVGVKLELTNDAGQLPPTQGDVDAAVTVLTHQIGAARMGEVGVMADPSRASDVEICSAARSLYDALGETDSRSRETLIRMVTGLTA